MREGRAEAVRDELLSVARSVVSRAMHEDAPPDELAGRILVAWLATGLAVESADAVFAPDDGTGVEALAFLVASEEVPLDAAAGIILRLPGRYPDSFESVPLPRPALPAPFAVRATFFEDHRGG